MDERMDENMYWFPHPYSRLLFLEDVVIGFITPKGRCQLGRLPGSHRFERRGKNITALGDNIKAFCVHKDTQTLQRIARALYREAFKGYLLISPH